MPEPYKYFDIDHDRVWPNSEGVYVNATHCKRANWVKDDDNEMQLIFYIACGVIMLYGLYWTTKRLKWLETRFKELLVKRDNSPNDITPEEDNFIRYMDNNSNNKLSRHTFMWIAIAIVAQVTASNIINTYTAKKLTVPEADGCSDADNFLTPVEDIFQFFEDGMTVRIGQAIGSNDYLTAGLLMKWGALGGATTGLLGAGISTGVTYISPIYSFFVPTAIQSDLPSNCPIIPDTKKIQSLARPYWIMTAFSWPGLFIQMASIGFFIGTGETQLWAIATVISSAAQVGIFIGLIDIWPKTTVYGLSQLIPPYLFIIIAFFCFTRPKYMKLFKFKEKKMFDKNGWQISYQAATDGSELLLKDLALTLQKTISLLMAAHLGLGQQYQLLVYRSIEKLYGYSYGSQNEGSVFPIALGYSMRLGGSRLLGSKNYKGFINLTKAYLLGNVLFGLVAFVAILITMGGLPYNYSSDDICKYQEYECSLETYNKTFNNIDYGMFVTAGMCWLNSVFAILQASLYAALDFKFIRNSTLICFFLVYLPCALLSFLYFESVIGLLISYNLPILLLIIIYIWRLFWHIIPQIEYWVENKMGISSVELRRSLVLNDGSRDISTLQTLNDEFSHTETGIEQSVDYLEKTEESAMKNVHTIFDD